MPDPNKKYRQLAMTNEVWDKLARIRATATDLRWQFASQAAVLEEIVRRLPEDYTL